MRYFSMLVAIVVFAACVDVRADDGEKPATNDRVNVVREVVEGYESRTAAKTRRSRVT